MKLRRLLTVLFSAVLTLSFLSVGCNSCNKNPDNPVTPTNVTQDYTYGYANGTLHNVSVDFEDPAGDFVKDRSSDYQIIYCDTGTTAATFIANRVANASGFMLRYFNIDAEGVKDRVNADLASADPANYYIFVMCNDLYDGEIPSVSTLGVAGYQIVTVGKNVFINTYTEQGCQMGALAFLREVIGYDYVGFDCVKYSNAGEVMPKMNIVERPDVDFRQKDEAKIPEDMAYGMGFTPGLIFFQQTYCPWVHNVKYFVGAANDVYSVDLSDNPDGIDPNGANLFASFLEESDIEDDASIDRKWLSHDSTMWQGCFTAHGDIESYKKLVNRVANMLVYAMVNSTSNNIMFSPNDVSDGTPIVKRCTCDACSASYDYYGNTIAGAMVSLINEATLLFNKWKADPTHVDGDGNNYVDREFNVVVLAYGAGLPAPTQKKDGAYVYDENGVGVPMVQKWFNADGSMEDWDKVVHPEEYDAEDPDKMLTFVDNVQVEFASSGANWVHTFLDPENQAAYTMTQAWMGLGGNLYIWAYEVCYHAYLYPYPSYDSILENYRYFRSHGVKWIYSEGTYENNRNSGFAALRVYLNSKALFNVNYNYKDLVDRFFDAYFDKAAPYMREIFDISQMQLRDEEKYGSYFGGVHNITITYDTSFPFGMILNFMDLIDQAFDAIEEYKDTDPTLYQALYDHIMVESFFPRISLCTTYAHEFSTEEIYKIRSQFKKDFDDYNPAASATHMEHHTITELYSAWGV